MNNHYFENHYRSPLSNDNFVVQPPLIKSPDDEKVTELTPDNKTVWERLSFLYLETGLNDKKAQADKKLQSLN